MIVKLKEFDIELNGSFKFIIIGIKYMYTNFYTQSYACAHKILIDLTAIKIFNYSIRSFL